jgi:hypothetical protein
VILSLRGLWETYFRLKPLLPLRSGKAHLADTPTDTSKWALYPLSKGNSEQYLRDIFLRSQDCPTANHPGTLPSTHPANHPGTLPSTHPANHPANQGGIDDGEAIAFIDLFYLKKLVLRS